MDIKRRLLQYLEHLQIGQKKFETATGLSNGFVNNIGEGISTSSVSSDNPTIKLAFIFCCYTGLDFADMFALEWKLHIRKSGMIKPRQKTDIGRITPLHDTALAILEAMDRETKFVFQNLPNSASREKSNNACNKTLKALVERAGIDKHITWHCARHSFGTNIEGDEVTVSSLLGHADTSMIKVYRRAKIDRKLKAVNSLIGVEIKP